MKDLGRAGELLSLLTLGSFLLNLVVSGIAFLATCASNSSAVATSVGTGLPLLFFLLHVVATFFGGSGLLGYCRFFTFHSLYSPADIIACNASMKGQFLLLAVMAAALYLAGGIIFRKKDLPL